MLHSYYAQVLSAVNINFKHTKMAKLTHNIRNKQYYCLSSTSRCSLNLLMLLQAHSCQILPTRLAVLAIYASFSLLVEYQVALFNHVYYICMLCTCDIQIHIYDKY